MIFHSYNTSIKAFFHVRPKYVSAFFKVFSLPYRLEEDFRVTSFIVFKMLYFDLLVQSIAVVRWHASIPDDKYAGVL